MTFHGTPWNTPKMRQFSLYWNHVLFSMPFCELLVWLHFIITVYLIQRSKISPVAIISSCYNFPDTSVQIRNKYHTYIQFLRHKKTGSKKILEPDNTKSRCCQPGINGLNKTYSTLIRRTKVMKINKTEEENINGK